MKKTLQDQYLLIKEGKGHKGVFLSEAKSQFPNIVRNAATFEEAVASLKTKSIISENIISVMPINSFEHAKKESYELAFENFLKEAKKKTQEEPEKAEASKPSKQVEKDLEHNFDRKDDKNPDNLIFDQIMMGYYAELKDPKNSEKTMQELKDIVFKNLAKDPIYYTKDGQFGTKGLGYTTEAPGLGTPKEAKGKYKASGYGDLKEGMFSSKPAGDVEQTKKDAIKAMRAFIERYGSIKNPESLTDDQVINKMKGYAMGGKDRMASGPNKQAAQFWNSHKHLFKENEDPKIPEVGKEVKYRGTSYTVKYR